MVHTLTCFVKLTCTTDVAGRGVQKEKMQRGTEVGSEWRDTEDFHPGDCSLRPHCNRVSPAIT